jgi:hypothetical protein
VRPLPPPHKADFVKQLKKGAPLELLLEEGWWEVEFECGPDKGGLCLVSAKRYQVQHTVPVRAQAPKEGRHLAVGLSPGAGFCPDSLPARLSAADLGPQPPHLRPRRSPPGDHPHARTLAGGTTAASVEVDLRLYRQRGGVLKSGPCLPAGP